MDNVIKVDFRRHRNKKVNPNQAIVDRRIAALRAAHMRFLRSSKWSHLCPGVGLLTLSGTFDHCPGCQKPRPV